MVRIMVFGWNNQKTKASVTPCKSLTDARVVALNLQGEYPNVMIAQGDDEIKMAWRLVGAMEVTG